METVIDQIGEAIVATGEDRRWCRGQPVELLDAL